MKCRFVVLVKLIFTKYHNLQFLVYHSQNGRLKQVNRRKFLFIGNFGSYSHNVDLKSSSHMPLPCIHPSLGQQSLIRLKDHMEAMLVEERS